MDPTQNQPTPPTPSNDQSPAFTPPAPVIITPATNSEPSTPNEQLARPSFDTISRPIQPIVQQDITPAAASDTSPMPAEPVQSSAEPAITSQPTFSPQPTGAIVMGGGDITQPTATSSTEPTNQPGSTAPSNGTVPTGKKPRRKKLLIIGGVALIVVAIACIGVFGLYLPNTPSHVFNTGINRSGKAIDTIVNNATTQKELTSLTSSSISGSAVAHVDGGTYSGNFTTDFDKSSLDGSLNVSLASQASAAETISAKVLSQTAAGAIYPDIYFQVSGIKSLGLDDLVPGISSYDGTWIEADSNYIQSMIDQAGDTSTSTAKAPTSADIAEFAKATSGVTRDYLFSTSADKGVLVKKSFVGKEKVDGLNTYHYKVGVNITNAKAYCVALANSVISTTAYKNVSGRTAAQIAKDKKDATAECPKDVTDSIKSTDTFDLWIDGKYKLIHKFRVYDKTDKGTYTDVGQTYTGGDSFSPFVSVHDTTDKTDGTFRLNVNLKTNEISGTLAVKGTSGTSPFDVTATVKSVPSSKPIQITRPANPVQLKDVLTKLGAGSPTGDSDSDFTSSSSIDSDTSFST